MVFLSKRFSLLSALVCLVLLSGCRTSPDSAGPHYVTRIYLEESRLLPQSHITDMVLPISGTHVTVAAKPIYLEWDILQAVSFDTDLGPHILFMFTPEAASDFYRTTATNQGKRLVLTINGQPVGARYIDRPVEDGRFYFYMEIMDESRVPEVAEGVQRTSRLIQERANRRW